VLASAGRAPPRPRPRPPPNLLTSPPSCAEYPQPTILSRFLPSATVPSASSPFNPSAPLVKFRLACSRIRIGCRRDHRYRPSVESSGSSGGTLGCRHMMGISASAERAGMSKLSTAAPRQMSSHERRVALSSSPPSLSLLSCILRGAWILGRWQGKLWLPRSALTKRWRQVPIMFNSGRYTYVREDRWKSGNLVADEPAIVSIDRSFLNYLCSYCILRVPLYWSEKTSFITLTTC
jgi:hypothetical protein